MSFLLVISFLVFLPGNIDFVKGDYSRNLTCKAEEMIVEISGLGNLTDEGYTKSDFHLVVDSPTCRPKVFDGENGTLTYHIPLDGCGTIKAKISNKLHYTNTIFREFEGNSGSGSGSGSGDYGSGVDIAEENVTCIYELQKYVPVTLALSGSAAHSAGSDSEVVLTISVAINDSSADISLVNCWIGATTNTTYVNQHKFMVDGCAPKDDQDSVSLACDSQTNKQTVEIFSDFFNEDESGKDVYLHCDVLVCESGDPASACSTNCCPSLSRRRRALSENHVPEYGGIYHVTSGPYSIPVLDGVDDGEDGGLSTGAIVGIVIGSVVFLIIVIIVVYYFCVVRRKRKRQQELMNNSVNNNIEMKPSASGTQGHYNQAVEA